MPEQHYAKSLVRLDYEKLESIHCFFCIFVNFKTQNIHRKVRNVIAVLSGFDALSVGLLP